MPTAVTHGIVGAAACCAFAPRETPKYFLALATACSILPDLDVISFFYRLPYPHLFFHRGITHSFFFSLIISFCIITIYFYYHKQSSKRMLSFFIFFFLLTASHGLLDALNGGGYGVALFLPFDDTRYSFPWAPLPISPIRIRSFFSPWGWNVMRSELLWIWLPCLILVIILRRVRPTFAKFQSNDRGKSQQNNGFVKSSRCKARKN